MKKWKPAPPAAVDAFAAATRNLPGAEPRKMFGYACVFAGGQMFAGLHEVGMVLRLSDPDRAEFQRLPGAIPFEPMPGRVMREYTVVPAALLSAPGRLRPWVERSLAYVSALPPKKTGRAATRKTRANSR